ncbi:LOW QUALITY PROTEIN: conserved hypothetical protein, partial [Neisseria gonorrhoeae PID1]
FGGRSALFLRYFSDTVKNQVSSIRADWTGLHSQEGDGRITISLKSLY